MVNGLWIIVGAPLLRSVAGWLQNALADNEISMLEWKKLGKTLLRLGVPALALYYGFKLDASVAAAIPFVYDYVFQTIREHIKKI